MDCNTQVQKLMVVITDRGISILIAGAAIRGVECPSHQEIQPRPHYTDNFQI